MKGEEDFVTVWVILGSVTLFVVITILGTLFFKWWMGGRI